MKFVFVIPLFLCKEEMNFVPLLLAEKVGQLI